ncbi:hypothetical protein CORC01_11788 [Colletotrichum orchidophilum]|uniref:Uncharacterized protein n=1 Tax=Colletotrichum orchidophilum TaxID=1209926 RepID=A0A1G4AUY0_9PEZI|nr:uncharacterized protein CORC01_11788 [Colletotrichum orchidophilum]OHE92921.1 hypothetical protein CORC01_11788 [Colletotrichum orchidophilum]
MLQNSPSLQRIGLWMKDFFRVTNVNDCLKLYGHGRASRLVTGSRHMAKWMFDFFYPHFCSPLFRSQNSRTICSFLVLHEQICRQWHISILG